MYSIQTAESSVERFESLLGTFGIKIEPNSPFEDECLQVTGIRHIADTSGMSPAQVDTRKIERRIASLMHMVFKLVRQFERRNVEPFLPHLQLLSTAQLGQGQRITSEPHQGSDKMFELLVGLSCAEIFENVRLDDPYRSKGDNPDVLADKDGVTWGFACKFLYSRSTQTMRDNLEKGVRQIEASPAQRGTVLFNLANVFPHDSVFPRIEGKKPMYLAPPSRFVLDLFMEKLCLDTLEPMIEERWYQWFDDLFESRKAARGVIGYVESVALLPNEGQPITTGCSCATRRRFSEPNLVDVEPQIDALMEALTSHQVC